jgi:hypothetical protein
MSEFDIVFVPLRLSTIISEEGIKFAVEKVRIVVFNAEGTIESSYDDFLEEWLLALRKMCILSYELLYGLRLLFEIVERHPLNINLRKHQSVCMMLISCIMLGHKMIRDEVYSLKTFSENSGIEVKSLKDWEFLCILLLNFDVLLSREKLREMYTVYGANTCL